MGMTDEDSADASWPGLLGGVAPDPLTSFSSLDGRKGSKRRSRRQGAPAKLAGYV